MDALKYLDSMYVWENFVKLLIEHDYKDAKKAILFISVFYRHSDALLPDQHFAGFHAG